MLRIGITGGIGSGKSTVCQIFGQLGIATYYADAETKQLYATHVSLQNEIKFAFGNAIFEGANLNRPLLASIVFNNPEKLQTLNKIVHPYVFANYEQWCDSHLHEPYTLKEAAILFESGSYKNLHAVVGIAAPLELRIARAMERDGISKEDVLQRIEKQMPQEDLLKRCNYVIVNDGIQSLIKQVASLHSIFMQLSSQPMPPFL